MAKREIALISFKLGAGWAAARRLLRLLINLRSYYTVEDTVGVRERH